LWFSVVVRSSTKRTSAVTFAPLTALFFSETIWIASSGERDFGGFARASSAHAGHSYEWKFLTHKERREEKWQDQGRMAATHSGMEIIGWRITAMAGRASEQEWIWGKTTTSESTIPGTKVRHLSQLI
jgi:hypothetical protein